MYKTEGQADSNFMKPEIDEIKGQVCCLIKKQENLFVYYVIDRAGDESWNSCKF